ncbi:phage exclusion lipoprotein Cor [Dickeya fangzhongdai]|uniref:phage exclusion lipoprotein Cor n=1 Tax=Dickeya fangzhongdai TaxID=1778540 RepID=UPI003CC883E5
MKYTSLLLALLSIACTETIQPACWAKIEIGNRAYDQPIYKKREGFKQPEYLVGDAFKYTWVEASKFKNLSECKKTFKNQ